MKTTSIVAGAALATYASIAHANTLTVYTYDSFTSEWGPGPAVEKAFEAECGCDLEFVALGDGAELLARLKLEGDRTDADVVLGLDTNLTAAAKATGLFAPHAVSADWTLPVDWSDEVFIPYDWGYFAFVYDKTKLDTPPTSFDALAASDLSIVIQDPRSSTPGLGLLLWMKQVYGDKAPEGWAALNDQIVTVTKGWSEAYGMFLEGEADLVLSYTTSPAYHLIAESDDSKAAIAFDDGNYMQIEVAGKIASTDQPELADQFLAFVASDGFQSIIPTTNWMYPAITPEAGLPEVFDALATPAKALIFDEAEAEAIRQPAVDEWLAASSK